MVDRVETTATVWLGLTLGCARCHDHKYDPLTQKEFYRFFAYFNSIDEVGNVDRGGNANPVVALPTSAQTRQERDLQNQIRQSEQALQAATTPEKIAAWEQSLRRQSGVEPSDTWPAIAGFPSDVMTALQIAPEKRTAASTKAIADHFAQTDPLAKRTQTELNRHRKSLENSAKSVFGNDGDARPFATTENLSPDSWPMGQTRYQRRTQPQHTRDSPAARGSVPRQTG